MISDLLNHPENTLCRRDGLFLKNVFDISLYCFMGDASLNNYITCTSRHATLLHTTSWDFFNVGMKLTRVAIC